MMTRRLIRLIVFPIVIALMILEWCGTYITHYSGMLCRLLSGMIFFWIIIGFLTGLGTNEHLTKMLVVGICILLVPQAGTGIVRILIFIRNILQK